MFQGKKIIVLEKQKALALEISSYKRLNNSDAGKARKKEFLRLCCCAFRAAPPHKHSPDKCSGIGICSAR